MGKYSVGFSKKEGKLIKSPLPPLCLRGEKVEGKMAEENNR